MKNVVLIADPDPERLQTLVDRLEKAGFHTLTATNGSEALRTASGYSPQLAVLPAELPELQGTEVCLRLKQDPQTEKIVVVLVGKDSSLEDRFVGEQVGADAYITLPIDDAALVARVKELFEERKLNR